MGMTTRTPQLYGTEKGVRPHAAPERIGQVVIIVAHDSPGAASHIAYRGLSSLRDLTFDQEAPLNGDSIAPVRQRNIGCWRRNILQQRLRRRKTIVRPMQATHLLRSK